MCHGESNQSGNIAKAADATNLGSSRLGICGRLGGPVAYERILLFAGEGVESVNRHVNDLDKLQAARLAKRLELDCGFRPDADLIGTSHDAGSIGQSGTKVNKNS